MERKFRSVAALADAIANEEIHRYWVSPGFAAALSNVTRQAIHNRIKRGTLDCVRTLDGVVLVDGKQAAKPGQGG